MVISKFMCKNLDLRFLLFYCLFMFFFFLFIHPFLPFLCFKFLLPFPPFSVCFLLPFFFHLCFCLCFFLLVWVSSLAYPNMLSCLGRKVLVVVANSFGSVLNDTRDLDTLVYTIFVNKLSIFHNVNYYILGLANRKEWRYYNSISLML
jgi:hypothetical protein